MADKKGRKTGKEAVGDVDGGLFDPDWGLVQYMDGMPQHITHDNAAFDSIVVHFRTKEDKIAFFDLIGQRRGGGKKRSHPIWFPADGQERYNVGRVPEEPVPPNRYPVYVISKGRWESRKTSNALEALGIPYRIVVEPHERKHYRRVIEGDRILTLPFSNLGQGSIPARNWVWEHSIGEGHARHWILDDNINWFWRLQDNLKWKIVDENPFSVAEDWADKYTNVALAGLNYFMFAPRKNKVPPFYLNTRVYSCILIKNDLPYRWRGRYNEDTDLSLRALKDGWVTVLFNTHLIEKTTTMTMKGGNTDELYRQDGEMDGRRLMAESLLEQHPDVVTVSHKWGRWQHHVDYRPYRRNRPCPVEDGG